MPGNGWGRCDCSHENIYSLLDDDLVLDKEHSRASHGAAASPYADVSQQGIAACSKEAAGLQDGTAEHGDESFQHLMTVTVRRDLPGAASALWPCAALSDS